MSAAVTVRWRRASAFFSKVRRTSDSRVELANWVVTVLPPAPVTDGRVPLPCSDRAHWTAWLAGVGAAWSLLGCAASVSWALSSLWGMAVPLTIAADGDALQPDATASVTRTTTDTRRFTNRACYRHGSVPGNRWPAVEAGPRRWAPTLPAIP